MWARTKQMLPLVSANCGNRCVHYHVSHSSLALQANIKYEEMREKAGDAVPENIKQMVQGHDNDINAEVFD